MEERDEEYYEQIDTFWECVKELDILVSWKRGGTCGRDGKDDTLYAYIYADKIGEFMDKYICDIDYSINAELCSCGAIAINISEEDLCYGLEAIDDDIWERRPEGVSEDW